MVMDWPQSDNNKDARGFLGLTSHYREIIEHCTHIEMPLCISGTPPKGNGDVGH
jgi:hypothetical protein